MNKSKAIKILQKQINKLHKLPESENYLWLDQTKTYIIKFFSKDSSQYSYINHFRLIDINAYPVGSNEHKSTEQLKKEVETFLNNCIETINDIGLYKHPKTSLIYNIPIPIIVLILSSIGYGIFYLGTLKTKYDNSNLNNDKINPKDSISIISPNVVPYYKKDSANYPTD